MQIRFRGRFHETKYSLPSLSDSDGSIEGELYRNLRANCHGAELTAEFNLLDEACGGRLSLYAGTGAGCHFEIIENYQYRSGYKHMTGKFDIETMSVRLKFMVF